MSGLRQSPENGPDPAGVTPTWRWWEFLAGAAVLVVGLGLRLRNYIDNRSLWLDEAMLACNVAGKSFRELAGVLDDDQVAPLGFLAAAKATSLLLGQHEYSLRLLPFVTGCLTPIMVWLTARRLAGSWAGLAALVPAAWGSHLIYYSTEFKQYSSDAFIASLLCLLAVPAGTALTPRRRWLLAGAGAIAVWFSHPACLVLFGIGIGLLAMRAWHRDWRGMTVISLICALWAIAFAGSYAISLPSAKASEAFMQAYWTKLHAFAPFPPYTYKEYWWYVYALLDAFRNPVGLHKEFTALGLALSLIALAGPWRRGTAATACALALPPVIAMLLSMAQVYPFRERVIMFLAPMACVLMGIGVVQLARLRQHRLPLAAGMVGIVGLTSYVFSVVLMGMAPPKTEELRDMLDVLAAQRNGEPIVVNTYGSFGLRYYTEYAARFAFDPDAILILPLKDWTADDYRKLGRFWLVVGNHRPEDYWPQFDTVGTRLFDARAKGASLALYKVNEQLSDD